jgi:hypothetical protein
MAGILNLAILVAKNRDITHFGMLLNPSIINSSELIKKIRKYTCETHNLLSVYLDAFGAKSQILLETMISMTYATTNVDSMITTFKQHGYIDELVSLFTMRKFASYNYEYVSVVYRQVSQLTNLLIQAVVYGQYSESELTKLFTEIIPKDKSAPYIRIMFDSYYHQRSIIKNLPHLILPDVLERLRGRKDMQLDVIAALPANFPYKISTVRSFKVESLKALLKKKGLKSSGLKAELLQRLLES